MRQPEPPRFCPKPGKPRGNLIFAKQELGPKRWVPKIPLGNEGKGAPPVAGMGKRIIIAANLCCYPTRQTN
jgi:hypothetical protein